MVFLTGWILAIIFAVGHILVRRVRGADRRLEVFLLYQMVFTIGLAGLFGFVGHSFFYERTAQGIGWAPHRPFQFELAAAELGWAVAGLLAIFIRKPLFWFGICLCPAALFLLAGGQHMIEMLSAGNYAAGNVWAGLADFLAPVTWAVLFIWYLVTMRKRVA